MKIYLPDIKLHDINPSYLQDYLFNTEDIYINYSTKGIFQIINNNIFKHIIKDEPVNRFIINEIPLLIDNSTVIFEQQYHIPFNSYYLEYKKLFFSLTKNTNLNLVIEIRKNIVTDFYFYLPKDINIDIICDDLLMFLSLLKLY